MTSKSPKAVVRAGLEVAVRSLNAYSHRFSPKLFTQHQLFTRLVLKNFLKTDYRGVVAHLADHPALLELLQLSRVPHYTTLQKAPRRLLASDKARRLLDATARRQLGRRRRVPSATSDSSGLQCSTASAYFVKRRKKVGTPWKTVVYHHYPKLGVMFDTSNHFILAFHAGRGPRPDIDEFRPLISDALQRVRVLLMTADARYDPEPNHRIARDEHGIRTIIPPKHRRPSDKPATGRYRRLMQTRFDQQAYSSRVQVETVMSMIKRCQGAHARGRSYRSQCRDLRLMALTHNVRIFLTPHVFYRAGRVPLVGPFRDQQSQLKDATLTKCLMSRSKNYGPEEIIPKLCRADVVMPQGMTQKLAAKQIAVSTKTLIRRRKEYGGLQVDQAKRLKELESESGRLKRLLADAESDRAILKEAALGELLSPTKRRTAVEHS